jgi:hypothetical protein
VLVVCEGEATEPDYINGFRLAHGANTVNVHVQSPGGDPKLLVERCIALKDAAALAAKRRRDANLAYDEVWCVFDVDRHARLDAARTLAASAGVHLAVSNPCFELWLLLHFTDHGTHATAAQARRLVRRHLPRYDKHLRFEEVSSGYREAARRAEALGRRRSEVGEEGGNPSTGVYRMTERIRRFGKEARLQGEAGG